MTRAERPATPRSGPKGRAKSSKGRQRRPAADQGGVRDRVLVCTVCGRPYKTQRGLDAHVEAKHPPAPPPPARLPVESPVDAVERSLGTLSLSDKHAVQVANLRQLAWALTECEPTDKAKTSKELAARWSELVADVGGGPSGPDWTESEE